MTDKSTKGEAGAAGASCTSVTSVVSTDESRSHMLQKQMSISKIGSFGVHNNACTGSKVDEIEVIESGNCQPRHPKVSENEKCLCSVKFLEMYVNNVYLRNRLYRMRKVWDN